MNKIIWLCVDHKCGRSWELDSESEALGQMRMRMDEFADDLNDGTIDNDEFIESCDNMMVAQVYHVGRGDVQLDDEGDLVEATRWINRVYTTPAEVNPYITF